MSDRRESPDLCAAGLARRQDEVLSVADLDSVGLDRFAVRRRVAKGLLHHVHPGVYALRRDLSVRGHNRAALISCGGPAWLGARSACAVWELIEWQGAVDVLLHRRELSRTGINVRTTSWLPSEHRRERYGLSVSSPARSLLDIGPLVTPELHEHAVAAALRAGRVAQQELRELGATGRPGAPALRAHLARLGGPQFSRSDAERILLGLCRRARLPPPAFNESVHGRERDAVWHEARVVGEFDGDAFHWSPASKRGDNRRDAELALRGWRTLRMTWLELTEEPLALAARIGGELARGYAH